MSYKDELVYHIALYRDKFSTLQLIESHLKILNVMVILTTFFLLYLSQLYFSSLKTVGKECEADLMNDSFRLTVTLDQLCQDSLNRVRR